MTEVAAKRLVSAGSVVARSGGEACTAEPFDALYASYRPLLRKIAIRKFGVRAGDGF